MKKSGILNAELARIVAAMGHTDRLVVCDAGLPIPAGSVIVDLALTANVPGFLETLRVILEELQVEHAVVATEMQVTSESVYSSVLDMLRHIELEAVPHDRFKRHMNGEGNIYFVRTGEVTPFANIILVSGVTF